jgi:hypothetical protein
MKKVLIFPFVLLSVYCNAQNQLIGKTYITEVLHECRETIDGGCDGFGYLILHFNNDSVRVMNGYEAIGSSSCNKNYMEYPINTYKWMCKKDKIIIDGLNEYEEWYIENDKLIGKEKLSNAKFIDVIFNEKIIQIGYSTMGGDSGAGKEIIITRDSIYYKSYLRGNTENEYNVPTLPPRWKFLIETFDLNVFKKIENGKSNLYFDGWDDVFYIQTETEKFVCINGKGGNYDKLERFFLLIIAQMKELEDSI